MGKLLTTIDGVGPLTAACLIAELGDPERFRSAGAIASYGLPGTIAVRLDLAGQEYSVDDDDGDRARKCSAEQQLRVFRSAALELKG